MDERTERALSLLASAEGDSDEIVRELRGVELNLDALDLPGHQAVVRNAAAHILALKAELASVKGHAEAMHKWIDRVLSCAERAEQDIGGETMAQIIAEGGPIYTDWQIFTAAHPKDAP